MSPALNSLLDLRDTRPGLNLQPVFDVLKRKDFQRASLPCPQAVELPTLQIDPTLCPGMISIPESSAHALGVKAELLEELLRLCSVS